MTERKTTDFHWVGETLMAKEFDEVVEICSVDWSGLDDCEAEHKHLLAAAHDLEKALIEAKKDLEEVTAEIMGEDYNSSSINAALAKARGETQ